jgi:hypothetical protein
MSNSIRGNVIIDKSSRWIELFKLKNMLLCHWMVGDGHWCSNNIWKFCHLTKLSLKNKNTWLVQEVKSSLRNLAFNEYGDGES